MSAAAKRRKTSETSNERLEYNKVLSELARSKTIFADAVERCNAFEKDTLENLNLLISEKKSELAELETQYEVQKKNAQITLQQDIAEFRYAAALKILEERKETAIAIAELEELRTALTQARATHEKELKAALDAENASAHAQLTAALKSKELEHKAQIAKLEANVEQQQREIVSQKAHIEHYIKEVDKQRELTKQVADAGKQGAITQTIGKT